MWMSVCCYNLFENNAKQPIPGLNHFGNTPCHVDSEHLGSVGSILEQGAGRNTGLNVACFAGLCLQVLRFP